MIDDADESGLFRIVGDYAVEVLRTPARGQDEHERMVAEDRALRTLRDDARLQARGIVERKFNPSEPRDPHGKWTEIVGGLKKAVVGVDVGRVDGDLTAGRPTSITPNEVDDLMQHLVSEPTRNLALLQVQGPGNEHLFREHLRELSRKDMPQLPETADQLKPFTEALAARGVTATLENVDPRHLRMTQNQLDSTKVAKLYGYIKNDGWRADTVLIVSKELAILDGHHRWAGASARVAAGHPIKVNVLRVDLSIDDLLSVAESASRAHEDLTAGTVSAARSLELRKFNPALHPHNPAGPGGGQWKSTHGLLGRYSPGGWDADAGHKAMIADMVEELLSGVRRRRPGWTPDQARQAAEEIAEELARRSNVTAYQNGPHRILIHNGTGNTIGPKERQQLFDQIDRWQQHAPVKELRLLVQPDEAFSSGVLGETFEGTGQMRLNARMFGGTPFGGVRMPITDKVPKYQYVIAHEWGHTQAPTDVEGRRQVDDLFDLIPSPSEYGATDPAEAFAEAWAEYHLTDGRTTDRNTRTYAEEFGWTSVALEPVNA